MKNKIGEKVNKDLKVFLFQSLTWLVGVHSAGSRNNSSECFQEFSSDILNSLARSLQNGHICQQTFA